MNVHSVYTTNNLGKQENIFSEQNITDEGFMRIDHKDVIVPLENKRFILQLGFKNSIFRNNNNKNTISVNADVLNKKNRPMQNVFSNFMSYPEVKNKDRILMNMNSKLQIKNIFSPNRRNISAKTESKTESKTEIHTKLLKAEEDNYRRQSIISSNTNTPRLKGSCCLRPNATTVKNNNNMHCNLRNDEVSTKEQLQLQLQLQHQLYRNQICDANQVLRATNKRHESSGPNNGSDKDGCYGSMSRNNLSDKRKLQMNYEATNQLIFEQYGDKDKSKERKIGIMNFNSKCPKYPKDPKDPKDLNMSIPNLDYSMNYMLRNDRSPENGSMAERSSTPTNVRYTVEDIRNIYSDKSYSDNRQIINYNNINITYSNSSPNFGRKNDEYSYSHSRHEERGRNGSCVLCAGCSQKEVTEKEDHFENGISMNQYARTSRIGTKTDIQELDIETNVDIAKGNGYHNERKERSEEYICKCANERTETLQNFGSLQNFSNMTNMKGDFLNKLSPLDLDHIHCTPSTETIVPKITNLSDMSNILEKRKTKEPKIHRGKEVERKGDTDFRVEKETDIIDYDVNELIERSTKELEFDCANHFNLGNHSLKKGKKKTMGACFLNLNYFTCQFLLSCDKA